MSRQVLMEGTDVLVSEQEASLMVALHSEAQQKDGATTLQDIAETLHISLDEAQRLLNDARNRMEPIIATTSATSPEKRIQSAPRWRRIVLWTLVLGAIVSLVAFASMRTDATPAIGVFGGSTAATRPAKLDGDTPFSHYPGDVVNSTSEFGLGLVMDDWRRLAVAAPSIETKPLRELQPAELQAQKTKLADGIFELLDGTKGEPAAASSNFARIYVNPPFGDWTSFDIPFKNKIQNEMNEYATREEARDRIRKAVDANWDKVMAAQVKG